MCQGDIIYSIDYITGCGHTITNIGDRSEYISYQFEMQYCGIDNGDGHSFHFSSSNPRHTINKIVIIYVSIIVFYYMSN